jgi:hypothetical protein
MTNKEFTKWRKRTTRSLPQLAQRIFALRGKGYRGCGLQWSLERELGRCIASLNDYDDGDLYHGNHAYLRQFCLQNRVSTLYKQLAQIEQNI